MKEEQVGLVKRATDLRLGLSVNGFGHDDDDDVDMGLEDKGCKRLPSTSSPSQNQLEMAGTSVGFITKRLCSETTRVCIANPWSSDLPKQQEGKDCFHSPSAQRVPPVVGWPPVRALRRNLSLQLSKTEVMDKSKVSAMPFADDQASKKSEDSMYVKVNMESYAVGRKINLKTHNSYESLSQALQKMFDNFFSVNDSKNQTDMDEVGSTKHVLIYEDNEGDRILVGDVPWEMFISTVKRLYIISGSKAPANVRKT